MKKLLLGTTALVGASAVAVGSASAMPLQSFGDSGAPILTASIVMQFEAGIADNDKPGGYDVVGAVNGERDGSFVGGRFAEIWFQGELTADNGLVYGARISLAADTFTRTDTFPGRKYIYFSGGWGSLELGDWIGPESGLSITPMAQEVSGNGMFDHAGNEYIKAPNSGFTSGKGDYQNANGNWLGWFLFGTKVSYYSPVIAGFQAGVSYSPTSDNVGHSLSNRGGASSALNNNGGYSDVIGLGVRYDGEAGGLTYSVAWTAAYGNADDTTSCSALAPGATTTTVAGACANVQHYKRDDLNSWNAGAKVGYAGFTLAGSYWDDDGSGFRQIEQAKSTGYTIIASYEFGPYKIGGGFTHQDIEHNAMYAVQTGFGTGGTPAAPISPQNALNPGTFALPFAPGVTGDRSKVQQYDFQGFGGGIGYTMAPGLKLYTDIMYFDFDAPSGIPQLENNGIVGYGGVYVSF
jgi:outer membrane protein OmpU